MWERLAGNYIQKQFQHMECDWITEHSTGRLVGSDFDYALNVSKLRKQGSHPIPGHIDNMRSLLAKIIL